MFEVLHDFVAIKPDPVEEDKSSGGIVLPTKRKRTPKGVVVAVGPGRTTDNGVRQPMGVKLNDRVGYEMLTLREVEFSGDIYHVTEERCIVAVLARA